MSGNLEICSRQREGQEPGGGAGEPEGCPPGADRRGPRATRSQTRRAPDPAGPGEPLLGVCLFSPRWRGKGVFEEF